MVTLEDFLTDLYSLFDQKIHCTLEQQNLVFSGKIDRINSQIFAMKTRNFHGKSPKKSPRKVPPKNRHEKLPQKSPQKSPKNRPKKSPRKIAPKIL